MKTTRSDTPSPLPLSRSMKAAQEAAIAHLMENRGSLRSNSRVLADAIAAVQASSKPLSTAKAHVRQFAKSSLPTVPPPVPASEPQEDQNDKGPLDLSDVQALRVKIIRHARENTNAWLDPLITDRLRALDHKAVRGTLTTADLESTEAFALSFAGSGALMPAAWRKLEANAALAATA